MKRFYLFLLNFYFPCIVHFLQEVGFCFVSGYWNFFFWNYSSLIFNVTLMFLKPLIKSGAVGYPCVRALLTLPPTQDVTQTYPSRVI